MLVAIALHHVEGNDIPAPAVAEPPLLSVLTTGLSLGHGGHRRMGASATTRPIGKRMEQAPINNNNNNNIFILYSAKSMYSSKRFTIKRCDIASLKLIRNVKCANSIQYSG